MFTITDQVDFAELQDGNAFVGTPPLMVNSKIVFRGSNNVLFCEEGVSLKNSKIEFAGDNSCCVLLASKHSYLLNATIHRDSSLAIGRKAYFNGALNAIASERQNILMGDDALLSFGIWLRTADPHLVYSTKTKKRVNYSKSILMGDHVWVGQDVKLLKGTTVGSGSIIAASAVVAGKMIPSNTSWAGSPARQIAKDVFFLSYCVHGYSEADTKKTSVHDSDEYIYKQTGACRLASIDSMLKKAASGQERLEVLKAAFIGDDEKNRFAINEPSEQSSGMKRRQGLLARLRK